MKNKLSLPSSFRKILLTLTILAFTWTSLPQANAQISKKKPTKKVAKKPTKKVAKKPTKKVAKKPTKKVAKKPTSDRSRAQKLYEATTKDYNKMLGQQVKSDVLEKQKKEFAAKQKTFSLVSKKLLKLTTMSDKGLAVCAYLRLGIGNAEMAEAISESPLPKRKGKKWSKAEAKAYRAKLKKDVSNKYLAQASTYYKKAIALAIKAKIKNNCALNARQALKAHGQ